MKEASQLTFFNLVGTRKAERGLWRKIRKIKINIYIYIYIACYRFEIRNSSRTHSTPHSNHNAIYWHVVDKRRIVCSLLVHVSTEIKPSPFAKERGCEVYFFRLNLRRTFLHSIFAIYIVQTCDVAIDWRLIAFTATDMSQPVSVTDRCMWLGESVSCSRREVTNDMGQINWRPCITYTTICRLCTQW
jgi:hypothetical protein